MPRGPGRARARAGARHGRADGDLQLAVAVQVSQRGRRVRERLGRGAVGGEVEVLPPAHGARVQVEAGHARGHVAAQVHVRAQLAPVLLPGGARAAPASARARIGSSDERVSGAVCKPAGAGATARPAGQTGSSMTTGTYQ